MSTLRSEPMTNEEMARRVAAINYEIIITHGMDGGVGFEWHGLFIHDPFMDPQYGAFSVNPVQQYEDAYTRSIFATDPAQALALAQQQLRTRANADITKYRVWHNLAVSAIIGVIESACGVRVAESYDLLETLTDEQVARVWTHVKQIAKS